MKSFDYYAVTYESEVYCTGCLPDGIDANNDDVHPIFANSEWSFFPTCDKCGERHDYITLLPPALDDTKIETWFERDRQHVELTDIRTDSTIIEWWDDDVSDSIQDGFLDRLHLHRSAYEYAKSIKLI